MSESGRRPRGVVPSVAAALIVLAALSTVASSVGSSGGTKVASKDVVRSQASKGKPHGHPPKKPGHLRVVDVEQRTATLTWEPPHSDPKSNPPYHAMGM